MKTYDTDPDHIEASAHTVQDFVRGLVALHGPGVAEQIVFSALMAHIHVNYGGEAAARICEHGAQVATRGPSRAAKQFLKYLIVALVAFATAKSFGSDLSDAVDRQTDTLDWMLVNQQQDQRMQAAFNQCAERYNTLKDEMDARNSVIVEQAAQIRDLEAKLKANESKHWWK